MKALIIKIAFIGVLAITVISCQSTKIINTAGIEITRSQNFTLNTEATFRPITELRSQPQPYENYPKLPEWYYENYPKLPEWYYEYYPRWSTLKKADGGTALRRTHDLFTFEWQKIYNNALRAYVTNNARLAMYTIDTLYQAAENDALLDTIGARSAYGMGCWGKGASGSCPFHHSSTASEFFINSAHSAILLQSWLKTKPAVKAKIDKWLDKGYNKFVKGVADLNGTGPNGGLYEYMNGKSGVLIYAIYKNDPELFLKYARKGIAQINQHMDQDGYIFSNSWRGVRSLWYHSLGVDSVFGFGELLETQGIVFYDHPLLKDKLRKSYIEALKGLDDPYLFEAKGYRGYNYTKVESKARRYLHKSASALQWIGAWRYPEVGKRFLPAGFDTVIGMNPKYMYADRRAQLEQRVWEKTRIVKKSER
jgi:hypothetical protein